MTNPQASAPPELSFAGAPLAPKKLLGAGAMSTVYLCDVVHGGRQETVAVKLLLPGHTSQTEVQVLQMLADQLCTRVPTVVGMLDRPGVGYLLQPVGTTLSAPGVLDEYPQLFRSFATLVDTLRRAHELNWVHRDMRLNNLLAVEDARAPGGVRLLLLDWGFAVRRGSVIPACQYCGAARNASNRLLGSLAQGKT